MSGVMKNHLRSRGSGRPRKLRVQPYGLGGAVAALLAAGSARAMPPPTILILSVAEDGRQQDTLRKQVGELVQRAGARVAEAPGLSTSARACADPGCLESLAKESRADYVLAARIERRSRHDRLIDMWLYGTQSGSDRTEQELCDVRDVKDCLSSLAGKLIGPQLGASPGEEPTPAAAADGSTSTGHAVQASVQAAPNKPQGHRPMPSGRIPGWRLGIGIGLGTLAAGALATAISASFLNGQSGPGTGCEPSVNGCVYNLRTPLIAGYVAAGVFATGAVLSLSLPMPRSARKEKP